MKQTIIWTALPNGIDMNTRQLKISVRASIRLQADSRIAVLRDFPDFSCSIINNSIINWCHHEMGFQIQFGSGDTLQPEWSATLEASWNDQRDRELWNTILPINKPVNAYRMPDYQNCRFRSFPASEILSYISNVYGEVGAQSPDNLPPIEDLVGNGKDGYGLIYGLSSCIDPNYEVGFTKNWEKGPKATQGLSFIDHFYQTYKFHEFKGNKNKPSLTKPQLDFHETIATLENYPLILNKMGLLFHLTCNIPSGIEAHANTTQWVRILPSWNSHSNINTINIKPCTAFILNRKAGRFESASTPGSDISHGLLKLSSPEYETAQVDVDGSALKLIDLAVNLDRVRYSVTSGIDTPDTAGLTALRSGGISIFRKGRDNMLYQKVHHAAQMNENPGDHLLFHADDLMMGLRVDVLDEHIGSWRSLCKRNENYSVRKNNSLGYQPIVIDNPGEGLIKTAIMKDSTAEQDLYLHEALVHWDGWSLAVGRPGKSVIAPPDENSEAAHDYVGESTPEIDPSVGLKVDMEPAKGSLPRLRYGRDYRLRVRVVDIAGNSRSLADNSSTTHATPTLSYYRYEPVNAPALAADKDFPSPSSPGESMDRLVIHSSSSDGQSTNTIRYIAPPRVSQQVAELHGSFDQTCPYANKIWYQVLCERHGNQAHLPDKLDQPINDVPYLPDPLAESIAIRGFPAQNEPFFINVTDGVSWPSARPFRICLSTGNYEMHWDAGQRILNILIPPAETVKLRMSSCLSSEEELNLMGVWKWIIEKAGLYRQEALKKLALSGGHWMLTPFRELSLINAVPKPLVAPVFKDLAAIKQLGRTYVDLSGLIQIHGKSTGKVDIYANWKERIDNLNITGTGEDWSDQKSGHPFHIMNSNPPIDALDCTGQRHEFGDTKYRLVSYKAVSTSSFREYFPEGQDFTFAGEEISVEILSSSRPAAPQIEYIIPSFGWEKAVQPDSSSSRRTGGGVRVYLKRPWFSSGDGELLGVLIAQGPPENSSTHVLPDVLKSYVTQWGFDPIWLSAPPYQAPTVHHFPRGIAQESGVTIDEVETLPSKADSWWLSVVGHKVEFDEDRQLWFCDIDIDAGPSYFPFVRLALVRYQPKSVRGAQVSRVALADFIQLTPERLAWVTGFPDKPYLVEVSVSGPSAWKSSSNNSANVMVARLEMLHPDNETAQSWLPVTPGWQPMIRTQNTAAANVWSGLVNLPAPRGSQRFRVVIEEYEIWGSSDSEQNSNYTSEMMVILRKTGRLVYADTIEV